MNYFNLWHDLLHIECSWKNSSGFRVDTGVNYHSCNEHEYEKEISNQHNNYGFHYELLKLLITAGQKYLYHIIRTVSKSCTCNDDVLFGTCSRFGQTTNTTGQDDTSEHWHT